MKAAGGELSSNEEALEVLARRSALPAKSRATGSISLDVAASEFGAMAAYRLALEDRELDSRRHDRPAWPLAGRLSHRLDRGSAGRDDPRAWPPLPPVSATACRSSATTIW